MAWQADHRIQYALQPVNLKFCVRNEPRREYLRVLGRIEDRAARFGERKLYRICWQTIFISGKPQWYGKPLTQL
jgi:hypothetical protein